MRGHKGFTLVRSAGFTLVELLVVVVILAILGTIGVSVFSGVQRNARDAKRREDITSIAKALETSRNIYNKTYINNLSLDFQGNVPRDPGGSDYCIDLSTTSMTPPGITPSGYWDGSCAFTGCVPAAGRNCDGWQVVSSTVDFTGVRAWTVCALKENRMGNGPDAVVCMNSSQQ